MKYRGKGFSMKFVFEIKRLHSTAHFLCWYTEEEVMLYASVFIIVV